MKFALNLLSRRKKIEYKLYTPSYKMCFFKSWLDTSLCILGEEWSVCTRVIKTTYGSAIRRAHTLINLSVYVCTNVCLCEIWVINWISCLNEVIKHKAIFRCTCLYSECILFLCLFTLGIYSFLEYFVYLYLVMFGALKNWGFFFFVQTNNYDKYSTEDTFVFHQNFSAPFVCVRNTNKKLCGNGIHWHEVSKYTKWW